MTRVRAMTGVLAALALAMALPAPAAAGTATVKTFTGGRGSETFVYLEYVARPGEVNRVSAEVNNTPAQDVATLTDTAGVTAGSGCTQTGPTRVRCTLGRTAAATRTSPSAFSIALGDGSDRAAIAPNRFVAATMDGGSGDDVLTGGSGGGLLDESTPGFAGNVLKGGDGNDRLAGGAERDLFDESGPTANGGDTMVGNGGSDRVSYRGRTRPVRVDLAGDRDDGARGEGDQVGADIEEIRGGNRGDRLTGNAARNAINGFGGRDVIRGGGGNDLLVAGSGRARDFISAGAGDDEIVGSSGSNVLRAGAGADTVRAGRGNDRISTRDRSSDVLNCGRGRDRARVDGRDYDDAACERVRRSSRARLVLLNASWDGGGVGVDFGCPRSFGRTCRATITISIRGRRVGRKSVRVRRGRGDSTNIPISRFGRQQIEAGSGVDARVVARTRLGGGRFAGLSRIFRLEPLI